MKLWHVVTHEITASFDKEEDANQWAKGFELPFILCESNLTCAQADTLKKMVAKGKAQEREHRRIEKEVQKLRDKITKLERQR